MKRVGLKNQLVASPALRACLLTLRLEFLRE